jgi:23S rRNA (uracil1939-C5)-methyltransferase
VDPAGANRSIAVTEVRIVRLAAGGDGVGRLPEGKAVFASRTAPGDLVELGELREHKRFARGRLQAVIDPSPLRVDPRCPHYVVDECGGCQLQHLEYSAQLAARQSFVGDALRRLAKRDIPDPPIMPAAKIYDYRTKLTLHVSENGRIGLHPYDRPHRVFDLVWCHITVPELMELWQTVRKLRSFLPAALEQVVLRLDRSGGRHILLRVGKAEVWSGAKRLLQELERRGARGTTIWWQPEGGAARAVAGAGEAYPATVFEQVHPEMGDQVRKFAVEQLGDISGLRIWDLYAGIGETTEQLISRGARVESVESDRRAVAEAEARGTVARRHSGRVEDLLRELKPPDGVIANPPRTGMDARVTAELERLRPRRFVYISCDPATLARDLQRLPSFQLKLVEAFDLFPQTTHVETVVVLEPA